MTIPQHRNSYQPSRFSALPPIVLGALAGMDKQGEMILGTWLYGGGIDHDVFDDPLWSSYMASSWRINVRTRVRTRIRARPSPLKIRSFALV